MACGRCFQFLWYKLLILTFSKLSQLRMTGWITKKCLKLSLMNSLYLNLKSPLTFVGNITHDTMIGNPCQALGVHRVKTSQNVRSGGTCPWYQYRTDLHRSEENSRISCGSGLPVNQPTNLQTPWSTSQSLVSCRTVKTYSFKQWEN